MKTPYKNGLLCAIMQGFGCLAMFSGFDASAFVVEPMLHSVATSHPELLHPHAGYYGQALVYFFYTITNVVAPWVMMKIGSRLTLFVGSLMFTLYFCSFVYIHNVVFYLASCCMGIGFALFYMGEGTYLTEHSNKKTVERNYGIVWSIGCFCSVIGGIVMFFTLQTRAPSYHGHGHHRSNMTTTTIAPNVTYYVPPEHHFTRNQIFHMFGAFAAISLVSNIIFFLLPKKVDPRSLAGAEPEAKSFLTELKNVGIAFKGPQMMKLIPFFSLVGAEGMLWMGVFPTTLSFSASLSRYTYLPALYAVVIGTAEIISGFSISLFSRKIDNFCHKPAMWIGCISFLAGLVLIVISTPAHAITQRGVYDPDLPIQSSITLVMIISCLLGIAETTLNNVRTVVCANVFPNQRAQAFSIGKLLQSGTACVLYFATSIMTMPIFIGFLAIQTVISLILFLQVIDVYDEEMKEEQEKAASVGPSPAPSRTPSRKRNFSCSFRSIIYPVDDDKLPDPEDYPDDWIIDESDESKENVEGYDYQKMSEAQRNKSEKNLDSEPGTAETTLNSLSDLPDRPNFG